MLAVFGVVFGLAAPAHAQEPDSPTLYLESGTGEVGREVATSLLMRMPATGEANAIELLLTFDDSVLAFDRLETSSTFGTGSGRPGQPGEVILLVSSEEGCGARATCQVGTLYWQALAEADTEIRLESVTVLDGAEAIPGVVAVHAPLRIGASPAIVEPTNGQLPRTDDATLGLGNAAVLAGLVLLLGLAVALPFVAFRLRRRRTRRQMNAGVLDPNDVYQFAARYLDDLQAAGSVDETHPDVEALARAHSNET